MSEGWDSVRAGLLYLLVDLPALITTGKSLASFFWDFSLVRQERRLFCVFIHKKKLSQLATATASTLCHTGVLSSCQFFGWFLLLFLSLKGITKLIYSIII